MRFSAFDTLSRFIQRKIRPFKPEEERTACWEWTGYTRPASRRYRGGGRRENADEGRSYGSISPEKATPMVHLQEMGYPVPANRAVYALLTRTPYTRVPKLERCKNPACVSPYHATPLPGAVRFDDPINPRVRKPIDVLAVLKRIRPSGSMSKELAAQECGLTEERITDEVWREYVIWDDANDE